MKDKKRLSGILLHPTSLPSPYGIGDLGEAAHEFVDFLAAAGQHLWQILPLTHTGYGDSPYQSFSAFAGQPLLISPSVLKRLGLVGDKDLEDCPASDDERVDYGTLIPWKQHILEAAYQEFLRDGYDNQKLKEGFYRFVQEQGYWLNDYALFMACKERNEGRSWLEWDEQYRTPTEDRKEQLRSRLSQAIGFYQFTQFLFFDEWMRLKEYANQKDIRIIGDIPIFVSMDSADVWASQHLFQRLSPQGGRGPAGLLLCHRTTVG